MFQPAKLVQQLRADNGVLEEACNGRMLQRVSWTKLLQHCTALQATALQVVASTRRCEADFAFNV